MAAHDNIHCVSIIPRGTNKQVLAEDLADVVARASHLMEYVQTTDATYTLSDEDNHKIIVLADTSNKQTVHLPEGLTDGFYCRVLGMGSVDGFALTKAAGIGYAKPTDPTTQFSWRDIMFSSGVGVAYGADVAEA